MPLLLTQHDVLPLNWVDMLHSPFRALTSFVWYLTAFLASTSLSNGSDGSQAIIGVSTTQYLLGLGEFLDPLVDFRFLNGFLKALEI